MSEQELAALATDEGTLREANLTNEELQRAAEVITSLLRAIKVRWYYPDNNRVVARFQHGFHEALLAFFAHSSSIILQITETGFVYAEKELYSNLNLKASIPFALYNDGLRELRFYTGVEDWELEGLVELISGRDSINHNEDDLVTLLWEREFIHIDYLAIDDFLADSTLAIPRNVTELRSRITATPAAYHDDVPLTYEQVPGHLPMLEQAQESAEYAPPLAHRNIFELSAAEVAALHTELERELAPTAVFVITDIIFDLFALSEDEQLFQDAAATLSRVLESMVSLGEFGKATELLHRISGLLADGTLNESRSQAIQQVIEHCGTPERIAPLGKALRNGTNETVDELRQFLLGLRGNAVAPLVRMLGEMEEAHPRRMLCDVLVAIGKGRIDALVSFLESSRWYLVRNVAYILGRIGDHLAVPALIKAYTNKDIRVRREVVQALGYLGGPLAVPMLVRALADQDEIIRSNAAMGLGWTQDPQALIALLRVVESTDFLSRSPDEQRAFFTGIGMLGREDAVPILREMLTRRVVLRQRWIIKLREHAAYALSLMSSPAARDALEEGAASRDRGVRELCQRVLKSLNEGEAR